MSGLRVSSARITNGCQKKSTDLCCMLWLTVFTDMLTTKNMLHIAVKTALSLTVISASLLFTEKLRLEEK